MRERQILQRWPEVWPSGFTWTVTEYSTEPQTKQEVKEDNMNKFWIVVNPNETKVTYKGNGGGYHKHFSEVEAIKEAERLTKETGIEYCVMGTVAQIRKVVEPTYKVVRS